MVTPVEPDGRGGVREVRPPRPGSASGQSVAGLARTVDRHADRTAKAAVRGALKTDRWVGGAALWAGRRLWGEARYHLERGLGTGIAGGHPGGGGGEGFFGGWSNPPEWMRVGDPTRWRQRQWFMETLANTAGAVWSSVWRRGA